MKLKALVSMMFAVLLLVSCADPITELKSGLTDDALSRLGATVGTKWENRQATNISKSINGNTDSKDISNPVVIKEGNTYKMWYSGMGADDKWRVIYATSEDGISWDIGRMNNPVLYPSNGTNSPDRDGVEVSTVTYDNLEGRYKMWYIGYEKKKIIPDPKKPDEFTYDIKQRLFYAASNSEDKGWIKYPNDERTQAADPQPVLEMKKTDGSHVPIMSATVLSEVFYDGYNYHPNYNIWFTYKPDKSHQLINARSFNGTIWDKQDFDSLELATSSFFVDGIKDPVVIRDYINNINAYKLWFIGEMKGDGKLGYAISETDGVNFNYYDPSLPPVFGKGEPGETISISSPWVIREDNKYKMWYIGEDENTKRIYYRESLDY